MFGDGGFFKKRSGLRRSRMAHRLASAFSSNIAIRRFLLKAEDGIRDERVTGVQTCALPMWKKSARADNRMARRDVPVDARERAEPARSEERRGGKECRDRGHPTRYRPQ